MAQWYRLGCLDCRLFVDLHKFLPADDWYERFDERRYDRDRVPGRPTYCALKATSARLMRELATVELSSEPKYVAELVPGLLEFVAVHQDHRLFLISDMGDEPWDLSAQGWWEWKAKPIAFDFHTYLPRYLVEDLGISDWPSAVQALKEHPSGYNPPLEAVAGDALEFKIGFETIVAIQNAKQGAADRPRE
jgi:hypothetical protein